MTRSTLLRSWALCALLTLGACSTEKTSSASAGTTAISVETWAVATRPLVRELLAVGSLRSDESVTVRPEIAGRIIEIGFQEGQAVKAGQLLFALDASIDDATLDQARADHALVARNDARATELLGRKLVSQAERDQARANLESATAALAVAEARLAKNRILAPFDGVAGLRMVSPGDYVTVGQDLVSLEAMTMMKVDFRVDQGALPSLHAGQQLQIEVDAYPGTMFSGEVYAIDPRIADATRSIALRARLPNADGRLRPGQFARVRLVVEQKEAAIVIPERAIFPRGTQQFVFVVDEESRARLREITLGQREPGQAEALAGLKPGEILIVSGIQQLSEGRAVQAKASSTPPVSH